jgi:uncharacterized protein (TIGR03437 family)
MHVPASAGATVSVTSAAYEGTPFTIIGSLPSWLAVSATSGTAGTNPATFTAYAAGTCNNGTGTSGTITLQVLPAASPNSAVTTSVTVNLVINSPTPLTPTPASFSMSHVKGSATSQTQNVGITSSSAGTYFTLNTLTLPIWLTVNTTYGIAPATGSTPVLLTFSTTTAADTMAPGTYMATVDLQVYGLGDLPITVQLFVTNSAPKLSISTANPLAITWVQGSAPPTGTITAISSDTPIAFSAASAGALSPIINPAGPAQEPNLGLYALTGLAYSFGTNISLSFNPTVYQTVQPGTVITGTVSLTWGSPATVTIVTVNLTVASPGATLSALYPATVPTAAPGTLNPLTLSGSGFVGGSNTALSTKVGVVVGGIMVADSNISVPILVNASQMSVTITVSATDTLLPFSPSGSGGQVTIGVCNGNCIGSAPTGTMILTIGAGPVIQGVTSSSSFIEVTPPALPSVAPYDMISIFGVNFCSSNGTGCATNTLLSNTPAGATMQYGFTLTPDSVRYLSVNFMPHGASTPVYPAPLLFATNNQINAMVPSALSPTNEYDIVVSFGPTGTPLKSPAFPVMAVTADPGVFTIGADGQGGAAALQNSTGALITNANPAGVRSGGSDSDTLQIYMTGLGAPTSVYSNGNTGSSVSPTDCIAAVPPSPALTPQPVSYLTTLNSVEGTSLLNLDGVVIQQSLINTGDVVPCFTTLTLPVVKIGGVAGTVLFAGFVPNTVAGLYQIDVQLPASTGNTFHPDYPTNVATAITTIASPVQLPVQVAIGSTPVYAQSGVMLWVAPKLNVEPPTLISGTVGVTWGGSCGSFGGTTGNCVAAGEGTPAYHYAVTSGVLPAGLSLNALTGVISGIPGANSGGTYAITVTATDSAAIPVTGTVSFTLTIAADLYLTTSGSGPYTSAWTATLNTTNATINSAVTVTGGTAPYTFSISLPATLPTGMMVNTSGQVEINVGAATPAGTYTMAVQATDSASTPLTGTLNFTLTINMTSTHTGPVTVMAADTTTTITTLSGHGGSGTYHYTLDSSNTASVSVGLTTGVVTNNGQADGSVNVVVDVSDAGAPPTGEAVAPPVVVTIPITIAN